MRNGRRFARPRQVAESAEAETVDAGDGKNLVDGLTSGHARGRGSQLNPGNRFESVRLTVLGEHRDALLIEHPEGSQVPTKVLADKTKSILQKVDSPDLPFSWTINPYRGCEHGCTYCYARPYHEYLGLSSGLDFEQTILAKHDAPELLRKALASPRWEPLPIVMSGVTDPYQPIERKLGITRRCLEVFAQTLHPVSLITKNAMIVRDLDLISTLNDHRAVRVAISLTTLDPALSAKMEPRASTPRRRLEAMRVLADAGIPVTVMTAPMIPGLNDRELPQLLQAASEHGAQHAGWVLLRLPHQVREIFTSWLEESYPTRASHIKALIRETRDGALTDSTFGQRHRGQGPYAKQIKASFDLFARRYGLDQPPAPLSTSAFRRPDRNVSNGGQLSLFGEV